MSLSTIELSNGAPQPTYGFGGDAIGVVGTDVIARPYYGSSGYGEWVKFFPK